MITQIYSIQTLQEAIDCIEAGADRIGLLVGKADGPYPCAIYESTAKEIFDGIRGKAISILISVLDYEDEIIEQAVRLKPDVLHLCAEFRGSEKFKIKLKEALPNILLMEAVGVVGKLSIDEAIAMEKYADILILDTVSNSNPGIGAAGISHDWNISKAIVEAVSVPVILAGGLGPENVIAAIEAVKPFGVDSLTKTSDVENGVLVRKNIDKVREFCRLAKSMG